MMKTYHISLLLIMAIYASGCTPEASWQSGNNENNENNENIKAAVNCINSGGVWHLKEENENIDIDHCQCENTRCFDPNQFCDGSRCIECYLGQRECENESILKICNSKGEYIKIQCKDGCDKNKNECTDKLECNDNDYRCINYYDADNIGTYGVIESCKNNKWSVSTECKIKDNIPAPCNPKYEYTPINPYTSSSKDLCISTINDNETNNNETSCTNNENGFGSITKPGGIEELCENGYSCTKNNTCGECKNENRECSDNDEIQICHDGEWEKLDCPRGCTTVNGESYCKCNENEDEPQCTSDGKIQVCENGKWSSVPNAAKDKFCIDDTIYSCDDNNNLSKEPCPWGCDNKTCNCNSASSSMKLQPKCVENSLYTCDIGNINSISCSQGCTDGKSECRNCRENDIKCIEGYVNQCKDDQWTPPFTFIRALETVCIEGRVYSCPNENTVIEDIIAICGDSGCDLENKSKCKTEESQFDCSNENNEGTKCVDHTLYVCTGDKLNQLECVNGCADDQKECKPCGDTPEKKCEFSDDEDQYKLYTCADDNSNHPGTWNIEKTCNFGCNSEKPECAAGCEESTSELSYNDWYKKVHHQKTTLSYLNSVVLDGLFNNLNKILESYSYEKIWIILELTEDTPVYVVFNHDSNENSYIITQDEQISSSAWVSQKSICDFLYNNSNPTSQIDLVGKISNQYICRPPAFYKDNSNINDCISSNIDLTINIINLLNDFKIMSYCEGGYWTKFSIPGTDVSCPKD